MSSKGDNTSRIHPVTTHVKADNQFQLSAATCWSRLLYVLHLCFHHAMYYVDISSTLEI